MLGKELDALKEPPSGAVGDLLYPVWKAVEVRKEQCVICLKYLEFCHVAEIFSDPLVTPLGTKSKALG